MGEIADLIAILAAIDDAASGDDERRRDVADLVPAYRVGDRFGWAGRFVQRPDLHDLPSFEQAMTNMAEPTRFASMLPRRLLAIALLARVFPERFGPRGDDSDVILRALITPGIVAGLDDVPTPPAEQPLETPERGDPVIEERASDLLRALADPQQLRRIEDWHEFLTTHAALVSTQLTRLPAPCTTRVIERPGTDGGGPIALLYTTLCVDGVDLRTLASRFLDPARWPGCSPWWCGMSHVPGVMPAGLERYLEVVAADCPTHLFEVAVFLDFARVIDQTTRTVVTYNMTPGQPPVAGLQANNAVDVDRGVIEARQEGDHVRVTTTKRVRFTRAVDGAALAAIACWVGYGDVATDVICNCSGGTPLAVDCGVASPFAAALDRLLGLAHACVTEAGEQARRVADRLGSKTYSAETAVADAMRVVPLAVQGWGKVATAFTDAIGDLARPAAPSSLPAAALPSAPFSFVPALPARCSLELARSMSSPYGEVLDRAHVVIHPAQLGPGRAEFHLDVDVTGLEGTAYVSEVVATSVETGVEVGRAPVYVIVP